MKRLHVTNFTMNSNLAVYLGAYTDKIFNLAILNSSPQHTLLYIIPYLKQMHVTYKIYLNKNEFIQDANSFHPNAILSTSDDMIFYKTLDKIVNILKIDAIVINLKNCIRFEQDWYSVSIYNPATSQTTYLYHTNGAENISNLIRLNDYQTIRVEWLPEIS